MVTEPELAEPEGDIPRDETLETGRVPALAALHTSLLSGCSCRRTFLERELPPPEEPMLEATIDFIAQYGRVVREGRGVPNYRGARLPLQNVRIDVDRLQELLVACSYPDLQFLDYLR